MRVLVVNNYGQFNHLIVRSIRDLVETRMISNQTPVGQIEADGLILGGGPSLDRAGNCAEYLKQLDIPILGICLGLQVMAETFGGMVKHGTIGGYAEVRVEIDQEDEILKGIPPTIKTWTSHADQVMKLPSDFQALARSDICEIEAMRHCSRPLYGIQWHPEVVQTEFGDRVLKNFLDICREQQRDEPEDDVS
ncbi:MAG: GMP synthase subunit A [Methanotrichaceae archaeon]